MGFPLGVALACSAGGIALLRGLSGRAALQARPVAVARPAVPVREDVAEVVLLGLGCGHTDRAASGRQTASHSLELEARGEGARRAGAVRLSSGPQTPRWSSQGGGPTALWGPF